MPSPDTQALEALLVRVETATGADREIDAAVAIALGLGRTIRLRALAPGRVGVGQKTVDAPHYTASADAVVALAESEMPGCIWSVTRPAKWSGRKKKPPFEGYVATDDRIGERSHKFGQADGWLPATALLAAFLKAKIAMERQP